MKGLVNRDSGRLRLGLLRGAARDRVSTLKLTEATSAIL
jgi:hypothetical protein